MPPARVKLVNRLEDAIESNRCDIFLFLHNPLSSASQIMMGYDEYLERTPLSVPSYYAYLESQRYIAARFFPSVATQHAGATLANPTQITALHRFEGPPTFGGIAAVGARAAYYAGRHEGVLTSALPSWHPRAPINRVLGNKVVTRGFEQNSARFTDRTPQLSAAAAYWRSILALEASAAPSYDTLRTEALSLHSDNLTTARAYRLNAEYGDPRSHFQSDGFTLRPRVNPRPYFNREGAVDNSSGGGGSKYAMHRARRGIPQLVLI
jgi:hypothetical protein